MSHIGANAGKVHHIKMDATLPHPLERPLSLAREFDLMTTWNHYIVESQLLHAPTIWESTVYAGLWMPFPFPQMDCLGTGRGFDLSEVCLSPTFLQTAFVLRRSERGNLSCFAFLSLLVKIGMSFLLLFASQNTSIGSIGASCCWSCLSLS